MTTALYALDYHDTRSERTIAPPLRQEKRQRVSETPNIGKNTITRLM